MALALAILGFVPGLLDPFNSPKAAALRVVGLAVLAGVVVEWVGETLRGRGQIRDPDARANPARWLDLAVFAWVLISFISTLAGVSPSLSLIGEIEQREGLLTTLALAGLYAGARRSHVEPEHTRGTLTLVLACAALAAAYAMMQVAGLDPIAWAEMQTYPAGAGAALRPFATLGNPILLGNVLAAALAVAVARLARPRSDAWIHAPLVMLVAAVAVATLSRGTWLACAAGVAVALTGGLVAGGRAARGRAVLALTIAILPALVWNALVLHAPLAARLTEDARAGALSSPARIEIARAALALWRAHPWLGTGPDAFALTFPTVQPVALWRNEWIGVPVHAHSAALQVLATLGVLGALAGVAWLAFAARAIDRAWHVAPERRDVTIAIGAALASLVVAGAVNPVGPAGAACFVVLTALAAGLPEPVREESSMLGPSSRRPVWAVVLCAALMVWAAVRECAAFAAAGRSRDALTQSTLASGVERSSLVELSARAAEHASASAPDEDELRRLECDADLSRAEAALGAGDVTTADSSAIHGERSARSALRLEPLRASNHQRLANALAMQARVVRASLGASVPPEPAAMRVEGLSRRAEAAFAAARRLAPADALILVDQARSNLALGRGEAALAAASAIIALYPEAAMGHALEAAALLVMKRRGEASAALRRALAARWEEGSDAQRAAAERFLRALDSADATR